MKLVQNSKLSLPCLALGLAFGLALISGCTSSSKNDTDALRERTADAAAAAKRDAKAIASGIKEGLQRNSPLDINSASTLEIATLPGITTTQASAIVAARPYNDTAQLYKKHILTKPEYERVKAQIVAKTP